MMRTFGIIASFVVMAAGAQVASGGPQGAAQTPAPAAQPSPGMPRERALLLLRSIHTAEADLLKTEKRYVGLPQLVGHDLFMLPELQPVRQGVAMAPDGGPIPYGNYALRVDPSASGRRYTVLLAGDAKCSTSWLTNETGVIHEGRPTGCDAK